jgi:hypothetical protein
MIARAVGAVYFFAAGAATIGWIWLVYTVIKWAVWG